MLMDRMVLAAGWCNTLRIVTNDGALVWNEGAGMSGQAALSIFSFSVLRGGWMRCFGQIRVVTRLVALTGRTGTA